MAEPLTADLYADLVAAIENQNAESIKQLLANAEFILINVQGPEDDDEDDESIGALTADLEDMQVLVVFSSEEHAGTFVSEMTDMFDPEEEVQGFMVEGDMLLDYLPEEFGMLINPETDDALIMTAALADELRPPEEEAAE